MNSHKPLLAAAALMTIAAATTAHAEIIFNTYNNSSDYIYAAYDMPDFDQQRLNALPNNGVCYCGPAATGNLLAYVATHGYPEVAPGVPFLASWESNVNYNSATNLLSIIGVNTNVFPGGPNNAPCGTSSNALFNELTARLSAKFSVNIDNTPTLEEIAQRGANNSAIGLILYGRYNGTFDAFGNFNAASRPGGHFEAVSVAMETDTMRRLAVRNSAGTDSPTDTIQSSFKTEWFDVIPQGYSWQGGPLQQRERLGPAVNINNNQIRVLLMQSHVWLAPKGAYTWDEFTPNSFTFWVPEIIQWGPQLPPPPSQPYPFEFTKLRPMPNAAKLAAIIDRQFKMFDQNTGEIVPLAPLPPDPITDLDVDRFGQIHLAAGNQVISINPEPKMHTALPMPREVVAIAAASSMQQSPMENVVPVAYALLSDPPLVAAILQNRDGFTTQFYSLDSNMIINPDSMLVAMNEHIAILTDGELETFDIDLAGSRFLRAEFDSPLSNIRDVVADDNNVLLLSRQGETMYTAWQLRAQYEQVEWHPMHRIETPGRLAVARSTNSIRPWSLESADSSEYDVLDGEFSSDPVADCRADFNFDGTVDGADMGLLLAEWSQNRSIADINRDGTVDGADLGLLLGAFGDCP